MDSQGIKLDDNSKHFNKKAYEEIKNKELVTYTYVDNDATNILKTLAYIFDFNFKESFNQLKVHDIINRKYKLLESSVDKEEVETVETIINDYIDSRLNND